MHLFGLDCHNPKCVHDTIPAFRLRLQLKRSALCLYCGEKGRQVAKFNALHGVNEPGWRKCAHCAIEWKEGWTTERRDLIFRANQRDSALSYMSSLGHPDPKLGTDIVENHPKIPPGYSARLFIFTAERMPKTALYFRMKPGVNEEMEPDKVFQCIFAEGANSAERRNAPQFELSVEQLRALLKYKDPTSGLESSFANIQCQHCHDQIPLKSFSTLSCREVELGD